MHTRTYILFYVTDVERSVRFYAQILKQEPHEVFPTFASFRLASGLLLGLWSTRTVAPAPTPAGGAELALVVPRAEDVDATYSEWCALGAEIVQAPVEMVFGRSFCAADPDGHRVRVMSENDAA